MAFKTIFAMWEDAYKRDALPTEWKIWESFRAWAIENEYKAEYGYNGRFGTESCLAAMPGTREAEEKPIYRMNLAELKQYAVENGIDIAGAETKKEIVALIAVAKGDPDAD